MKLDQKRNLKSYCSLNQRWKTTCAQCHTVRLGTSELKTGYHFESPGIQTFSVYEQVFCKASLHFIVSLFQTRRQHSTIIFNKSVNTRYRSTGEQTSVTRMKATQYRVERPIVISNNLTNTDRQWQNVIRGTQSISQRVVMPWVWEAKLGMLPEWVASKIVWSPCYRGP